VNAVEALLDQLLEPGEALEAEAEGIVRPWWIPFGFLGELLAQPVVVALTTRRVIVLETELFANRPGAVELIASREVVRAELDRKRRPGWSPVQGGWSRLILRAREETLTIYVDSAARGDATRIATALGYPRPDGG
jgi:hypothetical protein